MVSSVLSPEKIVRRPTATKSAAQNFISGGSVLGSSVVQSAANKIVGFQRAGVKPAAPAVDNIVSTISTSINNNLTTTINKTLQGFSADYQKRIKQVDDAKPIGILGKFLNVYKTAIGFINFFGNKRNINKLKDNLETLRKSFTESFEVAKLIRKVIIKIVKQLSNLPVATPSGGGGLNIDVDIPGGGLKRSAPKGIRRMFGGGKGKMLALGAGALGLGALGAGAVNALSDSPQAQAAGTTPNIPEGEIDRLSSIIDRFANVISSLLSQKPKQKPASGGAKAGQAASNPPAPPGPPDAENPDATSIPSTLTGSVKEAADIIAGHESDSSGGYNAMNQGTKSDPATGLKPYSGSSLNLPGLKKPLTDMTIGDVMSHQKESVKNNEGFIWAAGRYQFTPNTLPSAMKLAGLKPTDKFSPENQDKMFMGELKSRGMQPWDPAVGGGPAYKPEQIAKINKAVQDLRSGKVTPSPAQVAAAPTATEARQQAAQQVAQPPPSQQNQQPIFMPIDLSGGNQRPASGGGMNAPLPSQKDGPSVPFLPASNSDNFLVLYSRMVYNIVDG